MLQQWMFQLLPTQTNSQGVGVAPGMLLGRTTKLWAQTKKVPFFGYITTTSMDIAGVILHVIFKIPPDILGSVIVVKKENF